MIQIGQQEVAHMTRWPQVKWLQHQLALRNQWLNLTIKAVVLAEEAATRNPNQDLFKVFTLLGTRWISHHRAIFSLVVPGLYGEATALSRMLLEHTDLLKYFSYYPEEAQEWR